MKCELQSREVVKCEVKCEMVKWRVIHRVAKLDKIIILNDKRFEIPYKLSCKQPLLLKNKITNKVI